MTAEQLEKEFESKAVIRGRTLWFYPLDAIDFVLRCRNEGVRIIGLDAALVTESVTQPFSEQSFDFSEYDKPKQPGVIYDLAERHLRERTSSGLMFEVVIEHDQG